ncbi:sulfotransferase family protein [Rhodanobacter glycinis]|nr:sulfotransferase family protein [Rhodanobacter glycinis]
MNQRSMPTVEEDLRQSVRAHIDAQDWTAAQAALESLLQHVPQDVPARMELARVMLRQGLFRASGNHLLKAAMDPSGNALLDTQLVQRLCFSGEMVAARTCLDRAGQLANESVPLLVAQAHLRWTLGEFNAAKELMDRAAAAGIDTPDQFHLYATLLQVTGDIERAGQVLETCLRRWPDFGDAAAARSNLRRQTAPSNHLAFLHGQLRRLPADDGTPGGRFVRAEFESALFKELDDLGRHDEAWPALARSNALMSSINPYDGLAEAAIVEGLIDVAGSLGQPEVQAARMHADPTPIFIVGMPRSGTTLLDRMLSSHSQVTSAGEINDFLRQLHWVADVPPVGVSGMLGTLRRIPKINLAELGERYLAQTQWRAQGCRFYIDKLPVNIQMVPFIRRALPHAPILHMVRDPMDVCFSNFRAMFGNVSAYSYDMQALAHYHGLYRRLANEWHVSLPDAMLDVHYADLVREPAAVLRSVLKHCGLKEEDACLHPERNAAPVATPSSMQVREPIHTRGLGTWQPYAHHLEPLRRLLG